MYTVSQTWIDLMALPNHYFETRVNINGVYYTKTSIIEMSVQASMFAGNQPGCGGCISAELDLKMLAPSATIPRMAKIKPYVRVTNGTTYSEWIPQGVFWIDTRETTNNDDGIPVLTIHAYDSMLKTEADYPSTATNFPKSDINVVKEIAKTIGLQTSLNTTTGIDPRTVTLMSKAYQIGLPVGYSMREVLGNIGAMYGGNWIMNYDGKLLLIPVGGIPVETNYLVTGIGEPITFGGDRILV